MKDCLVLYHGVVGLEGLFYIHAYWATQPAISFVMMVRGPQISFSCLFVYLSSSLKYLECLKDYAKANQVMCVDHFRLNILLKCPDLIM